MAAIKKLKKRGDSLEKDVRASQLYDYYLNQESGDAKLAEVERQRVAKMLDLNKQIREYDLSKI